MGNKIRAGIVGAAIVAGTMLAPVTANAAPAPALQGKIAAVQVHNAAVQGCGTFWSRAVALFVFHLLYPGC